ncbi:MAG: hypothetical protein A3E64_00140 [Candidatus Harrisonbacteria bacterium RIFCSPHIGHO2_12_FULL_48_16]|uniref:Uncharacterized protein n=1 Tax=Candidatus Harrisonbacteria bacterium RIFCSPHIGHO2_12_FULL_48_16 TaxID=1798405 RepID=A0A1G1ZI23_9BACT|nr:MAG: hypothetical protein A3E64_00140 [Candidatus Harrisonbacteria bacterium RIFCSPHIGHO2_12_FULL_48_16]
MIKDIVMKLFFGIFGASFILLGIATVLFYIHLGGTGNVLVVNFDGFRGINFLGNFNDVFGILLTGFFILAINILLSWGLYKRNKFLAHLLPFATLFISLLILIAVAAIISVN